jgi:hypothetical protein
MQIPYEHTENVKLNQYLQAKSNTRLTTDLPNKNGTRILLQSMATDASTFEYLTTARELAAEIRKQNPATLLLQPCCCILPVLHTRMPPG